MLAKHTRHHYVHHHVNIRDKCAVFTRIKDVCIINFTFMQNIIINCILIQQGKIKDVIPLNNAYVTIRQSHPKNIIRHSGHKVHTLAHDIVPHNTSINTNTGSYCPHLALDHGAVELIIRLNQKAYKRYLHTGFAFILNIYSLHFFIFVRVVLVAPNRQEAMLWMEALRSNAKGKRSEWKP